MVSYLCFRRPTVSRTIVSCRIRRMLSSSNAVSSNSLAEKHQVSALLKECISCDQFGLLYLIRFLIDWLESLTLTYNAPFPFSVRSPICRFLNDHPLALYIRGQTHCNSQVICTDAFYLSTHLDNICCRHSESSQWSTSSIPYAKSKNKLLSCKILRTI